MPTVYHDQFFVMDPGSPPPAGTVLTPVKIYYTDQDNNNFISPSGNDSAGGLDITKVWVNDTITVVMNGVTKKITGVTFYRTGGPSIFTPTDGTILTTATFVRSSYVNTSTQIAVTRFGPPCFTPGTRIGVPGGSVPIETMKPGDLVETLDHGAQPIRWIGSRAVPGAGRFAPIRFAPGVMGNDRALLVSPQHQMLIEGWQADLYFGQPAVLVAAKHLLGLPGVATAPVAVVTYLHLMFDRHEIIFSEGAATESFHPGSIQSDHDSALRDEVVAIFPELASAEARQQIRSARPVMHAHEARILAA